MKRRLVFATYLILSGFTACQFSQHKQDADVIPIEIDNYRYIRDVDIRYQSYNIEMASVLGGDFWKPYSDMDTLPQYKKGPLRGADAFQPLPPIDLYNPKLRTLAKGLSPAYVRVSGSWATSAYFQDNDKPKLKKAPKGFSNVLTRKEWKGVIDFIKATDSKLVTSFAGSQGVRGKNGIWTSVEAQKLVDYTSEIDGTIYAAQLFNEPNILAGGGVMPLHYTASDFAMDVSAFTHWAKRNVPDMKIHGPGNAGEGLPKIDLETALGKNALSTQEMMSAMPRPTFDIYSFHFYGGVSMRSGNRDPWAVTFDSSLSKSWLTKIDSVVVYQKSLRDRYLPGAPIWNTETAQASWGGDPWAATYIDVFRYLHQLGVEAKLGVSVNIHNTLASSEYSLINRNDFTPKPDYWGALLWARLMGTQVFDAGDHKKGVYLFVHSLKENVKGKAVLLINTTKKPVLVDIPADGKQYTLSADSLTSRGIKLNGVRLKMTENEKLPTIKGRDIASGKTYLPQLSVTFLTFNDPE